MCRTVIIFNVHCEHEHAEIQKCSDLLARELKRDRKGFFSKMFSSPPRNCRRPQQTRDCNKVQVCPDCAFRGITYEQLRKDRDSAQRRPPRPVYRHQTDLDIGNPISHPNLQRSNTRRRPADRRPQGLERSNAVQFHGEAPRLPNVRATAIFREPENLHPDTLRQYLGSSGVPFEDPNIAVFEESPIYSLANRRLRGRSNSRRHLPNTPHPHDNGSFEYMDRPLPPAPLRPHRATTNSTSTSRPPPAPSRSLSQRYAQSSSERQPDSRRASSQRPSQPPNNERQLELWRSSSQRPSQSSNQQLGLAIYVPQSHPQSPSYHRGMPTDKELNRMSMEIESVESAWVNAGRRSSQQRPVDRQSMGSLTAPRRHRSQRDGKYA
ncbi:hypothetical protein VC83_08656 [Pseudogymnoascus destructans]|uniref:Uncharacterized protein n=1 Tax=Pseudogymnoascus destructans TaxID=655981 RepID=A0A177A0Q2_9PEZI|nr:uncharacterized protein VC83_08656 [Pseudogymnoascus destructans]OAF54861.1 hypothetical protein VC83_08656 [Pseudogymnoascus destructans]